MQTANDIIEKAGGADRVAMEVGVVIGQVKNRARDQHLPAAWFDCLERLCGEDLPRHLFSFKGGKPE